MNRIEFIYRNGLQTTTATYDAVVLTISFALCDVELVPSLELVDWKRNAIAQLDYGTSAKMMVGFDDRLWVAQGSNGTSYSDLPHQTTWESNPTKATNTHAVLTYILTLSTSGKTTWKGQHFQVFRQPGRFFRILRWVLYKFFKA